MSIANADIALLVPVYAPPKDDLCKFLKQCGNYCCGSKIYFAYEKDSCSYSFEEIVHENAVKNNIDYVIFNLSHGKGIGFALAYAVSRVTQSYVMRHDIGDDLLEYRISEAITAISNNQDVDIFYADAIFVKNNIEKTVNYPRSEFELKKAFIYKNPICHPTVVFKKSSIIEIGNYDASLRYCEDLDLWLRAIKNRLKFFCISKPAVRYLSPETVRTDANWRANLIVRLRNFGSPNLFYSSFSIFILALFCILPKFIKSKIYDRIR